MNATIKSAPLPYGWVAVPVVLTPGGVCVIEQAVKDGRTPQQIWTALLAVLPVLAAQGL